MMAYQISLTSEELMGISNALNEVCNGVDIDDEEFETRLGVERTFLLAVLKKIGAITRSPDVS